MYTNKHRQKKKWHPTILVFLTDSLESSTLGRYFSHQLFNSSSAPPHPFSTPSLLLLASFFCMNFDCTQGATLHPVPSSQSHTSTNACMRAVRGWKTWLAFRGFVYQMCCQIMSGISCQGKLSGPWLPTGQNSNNVVPQCDLYSLPPLYMITHHFMLLMLVLQKKHFSIKHLAKTGREL